MQLFLFSSFLCKPTCLFQLEQTVYSHFSWNKWIFWSLVFQEFFNLFTVMKTETTSKTTKLEHSPLFWNLNFDKKNTGQLSTAQSWYFLRWKKNVFLIKIEKKYFLFSLQVESPIICPLLQKLDENGLFQEGDLWKMGPYNFTGIQHEWHF